MGVKDADFRQVSIAVILGSDATRFQRMTKKGQQQTATDKRHQKFNKQADVSVDIVEKRGESVRMEQHERCSACKSLNTKVFDASYNSSLNMDEGTGTILVCKDCSHIFPATKK